MSSTKKDILLIVGGTILGALIMSLMTPITGFVSDFFQEKPDISISCDVEGFVMQAYIRNTGDITVKNINVMAWSTTEKCYHVIRTSDIWLLNAENLLGSSEPIVIVDRVDHKKKLWFALKRYYNSFPPTTEIGIRCTKSDYCRDNCKPENMHLIIQIDADNYPKETFNCNYNGTLTGTQFFV